MSDQITSPAPAPKRRGWLRIVGWGLGIVLILLIVAYFIGTSSAFFKGVILPKVSSALNAKVTVTDASISPFKEVVLRGLKVETTGADPLVAASEVRARYSLLSIIGGHILVDELTLASPTITLVQNPDGTSNLDPLLKGGQKEKPAPPSQPSKPAQLDIRKIALTEGTIRQVKLYAGNHRDVMEISHLNVAVDGVKNGQSGKLTVGANLDVQNNPPAAAASGSLQAKLDANFAFALTPDLKPGSIQGTAHLAVSQAAGALAQATGFGANLDSDLSSSEIKQVALRFQRGDTRLGEINVSGPFDMNKTEGRLTLTVLNIDKNLLNLAGAANGLDFGPTRISSTNQIQLAKAGTTITLSGQFNLNDLQVTRTNQTTPALGLHADYDLSIDKAASNLVVRAFNLNGTEKGAAFLHGELTSPMSLSWGNAANAVGDSSLKITVTHFNLADWKPFLGDSASTGDVNATLQLLSQQAGKRLSFDVNSKIDNLTAGGGSNQLSQLTVNLQMRGQAADLKQYNFPVLKLELARQDQPIISLTGSGTYDQANQGADLQLDAQVMLATLLRALPHPDMTLTSGNAALKAHVTQNHTNQNITGTFALNDLSGQFGGNTFRSLGTTADLDLGISPAQVEIRKCQIGLTPTARATNQVQLTGQVDMTQTNAIQGNLKLVADSLDLTSYYDIFGGQPQTPAAKPTARGGTPGSQATPPPKPEQEPEAKQLPLRNFTADADIRHLYLREVEVTNFLATVKIDGGHVVMDPFKLGLNGAPMNTAVDVDLGVPGYKYNVAFNALAVPLAPLVNSFQPDRKGQVSGTFTAQAKIDGTGTTGASLQKNLAGNFDFWSTNLNLSVDNVRNPMLKTVFNVIALIPELARGQVSAQQGLLALLPGSAAGQTGGLSKELQKSPINQIVARGTIGAGKVTLQQTMIQSPAFEADATGTITLAAVLTNSQLQIPVSISLDRAVADRANLVPANTPTNQPYVKLPDFFTMIGTVGDPKTGIKPTALAGTAFTSLSGLLPNSGGKTANILQGIGGLLGGGKSATNVSTNQPATNRSPASSLLDLLGPKKQ